MNCQKCGAQIPAGNAFCPACGEAAAQVPPQGTAQQPQQNFQQAPPQGTPPPQQGFQQAPPQGTPPPQQGYQQQYQQTPPKQDFSGTYNYSIPPSQGFMGAADYTASVHPQDAATNTMMGVLSYLLFFVPLITGDHKRSPFVKFHVNQGLMLWIVSIGWGIVSAILMAIIRVEQTVTYMGITVPVPGTSATPGWLIAIVSLIYLVPTALCILGIVNVVNKKSVDLPIIGKFRIIK